MSSATSCSAWRSPSDRRRRPVTPAVDEVNLLTTHGILHLLGYDHAEPDEHKEMFGLQARLLAEWQGARAGRRSPASGAAARRCRADMSSGDIWLLVAAAVLVLVAGLFSSADAALSSFSKARAEELSAEGRSGAGRLLRIVEDPARYLNTALFLRMLAEISRDRAGRERDGRPV